MAAGPRIFSISNFSLSASTTVNYVGSHENVITLPALGGMVVVGEDILLGLEDSRVEVVQPL